jgi:hypothetical protein
LHRQGHACSISVRTSSRRTIAGRTVCTMGENRADGALLTCEPAKVLPMAQRYFLF